MKQAQEDILKVDAEKFWDSIDGENYKLPRKILINPDEAKKIKKVNFLDLLEIAVKRFEIKVGGE